MSEAPHVRAAAYVDAVPKGRTRKSKAPFTVLVQDPLHKGRSTFFVRLNLHPGLRITRGRKHERIECGCGAKRTCTVLRQRNGRRWVCVMTQTWADEHDCAARRPS